MRRSKPFEHLLFEIGVEEIPASYLTAAMESVRRQAPVLLEECGYQSEGIEVYGTPRRLVLYAPHFSRKMKALEERLGPLKDQCYQNGAATPALAGFLKSVGKKEADIVWKETPKGPRVSVLLEKKVKPLRYFFETLPLKIEFRKLMRWEAGRYRFTRPIRWTFALIGTKVQSYQIANVKSGSDTWGHRFLAHRKIRILKADLEFYKKTLRTYHVILDPEERLQYIEGFFRKIGHEDHELAREVSNLVEEPFAIFGSFPKEYLCLPSEVLSTCMKKYQRIFSCQDAKGKLTNRFLAIVNGKRADSARMARNYESVLISRLEDAKFFYQEDTKSKLEEKMPKLKELIFLGELGSYWDKAERVEKISEWIGSNSSGHWNEERSENVRQVARLCKVDLVTHLVYEFPELQGIAGSEYARRDGFPKEVCSGILEHYLPRNLAETHERLRKNVSEVGAIVGLADRFDLLVGALGIGIEPSGSQDPYGLRRTAGGMVKLIRAFHLRFSLAGLVDFVCGLYENRLKVGVADLRPKLVSFIRERLFFELDLRAGTKSYEILEAVLASDSDDLVGVYERFGQLSKLFSEHKEGFLKACKVVERTHNILKGVKGDSSRKIEPSLFKEGMEKVLYDLVLSKEAKLNELAERGDFRSLVESYGADFLQPVEDFFAQVMVNVEEEALKCNRLALMKKVKGLCADRAADLSQITNQ